MQKAVFTIKTILKTIYEDILIIIKWVLLALITGAVTGLVGGLFHMAIDSVTKIRTENGWIILLLPLAGVVIAMLYRLSKHPLTTNMVIEGTNAGKSVSFLLAPFIFISAVITHLFGGSVGREGAALQIGGGLGATIGHILRVSKKNLRTMVVCGMAGAFSAIFTTPVTAAVFAVEVASIGKIHYFELLPAIISSLIAFIVTKTLGNHILSYQIAIPEITLTASAQVIILALLTALVGILFCVTLHKTEKLMHKVFKKDWIIAIGGGVILVLMTMVIGNQDYNGAGMSIINNALAGKAVAYAFILKLLFTAVSVGAGFKGGEIVPAFFIGATFGVTASMLLGIDPGFGAAIGMVCMFCSITNCFLASVILGAELFGAEGILFFAIACVISNVISGDFGLYSKQKLVYSRFGTDKINTYTH